MVCPQCRNEAGTVVFCPVCRAFLPTPEGATQARISSRIGAMFMDGVVVTIIGLVYVAAMIEFVGHGAAANSAERLHYFFLASLAALPIYFVLGLGLLATGRTPGKWLVGIRAADKRSGDAPGFWRMLVREWIGKPVSGLFFGLGWLWSLWDKDAQAWHDKIADTVVLHNQEETGGKSLLVVIVAALSIVSVMVISGGMADLFGGHGVNASQAPTMIHSRRAVAASTSDGNASESVRATRRFMSGRFGYQFDYPASFHESSQTDWPESIAFSSPDNSVTVVAMGSNAADHTVADALAFELAAVRVEPTYEAKGKNWIVLSWRDNGKALYLKRFVGEGSQNTFIVSFPEEKLQEENYLPAMIARGFRPGDLTATH